MELNKESRALVDAMSAAIPTGGGDPVAFRENMEAGRMPPAPEDAVAITDVDADGIPVRIYRPEGVTGRLPVLVYFHGGGFVSGSIATFDRLCQRLARLSGCAVASVEYRLAPEHPFPAAPDDAERATRWIAANGDAHDLDTARMALGGDSAGGNLALVTAIRFRDGGGPPIAHLLLIYPAVDLASERPSHEQFGDGFFVNRAFSDMCLSAYTPDAADRVDPVASPLRTDSLADLPSATVVVAGCDPARDDSLALIDRMRNDGVAVNDQVHEGTFHGFLSMFGMLAQADDAVEQAGRTLSGALHDEGEAR